MSKKKKNEEDETYLKYIIKKIVIKADKVVIKQSGKPGNGDPRP